MNVDALPYLPDYPAHLGDPVKVFRQGAKRALLGLRLAVLTSVLVIMALILLTLMGGWAGLSKSSMMRYPRDGYVRDLDLAAH